MSVIVSTAMTTVPSATPTTRRGSVVPGTASRSAATTSARPRSILQRRRAPRQQRVQCGSRPAGGRRSTTAAKRSATATGTSPSARRARRGQRRDRPQIAGDDRTQFDGDLDSLRQPRVLSDQQPAQVAHAAARPELGRVGADAEHLADFGEAEAPHVVQQQGFASIGQHGIERAAEAVSIGQPFDFGAARARPAARLIGLRAGGREERRSISHTCLAMVKTQGRTGRSGR